jgi:hypothetical protein
VVGEQHLGVVGGVVVGRACWPGPTTHALKMCGSVCHAPCRCLLLSVPGQVVYVDGGRMALNYTVPVPQQS